MYNVVLVFQKVKQWNVFQQIPKKKKKYIYI